MSNQEAHSGELREVAKNCVSFSEKVLYLEKLGIQLDDWEIEEEYLDIDHGYVIIKDRLFQILNHMEGDENEATVRKIGEDRYSFFLNFYNGGCSFEEALEWGFDRMEGSES